jgi:hypothetical protein
MGSCSIYILIFSIAFVITIRIESHGNQRAFKYLPNRLKKTFRDLATGQTRLSQGIHGLMKTRILSDFRPLTQIVRNTAKICRQLDLGISNKQRPCFH